MREARYEQIAARAAKPAAAPLAAPTPAEVQRPAANLELPEELLCGHRAISGRTCTREKGHASKSHRYS